MKNQFKRKIEKRQKTKEIREAVRRVTKGERAWKSQGFKMDWKDWSINTIKGTHAKNLPAIKILREREVKMVEIDLDIPDEVESQMYQYGIGNIHTDRKAIVNWVFNLALRNSINNFKKKKSK